MSSKLPSVLTGAALLASVALVATTTVASAEFIDWATWYPINPTIGTITGTPITVTVASSPLGASNSIGWLPPSSYTSALVSNAPPHAVNGAYSQLDVNALSSPSTLTITFSNVAGPTPVDGPILAIQNLCGNASCATPVASPARINVAGLPPNAVTPEGSGPSSNPYGYGAAWGGLSRRGPTLFPTSTPLSAAALPDKTWAAAPWSWGPPPPL